MAFVHRFVLVLVSACVFLPALSDTVLASRGPFLVDNEAAMMKASSRLAFQNPRGLHGFYDFYWSGGDLAWFYKDSQDGLTWSLAKGPSGIGFGSGSLWITDTGAQLVVYFVATGFAPGSVEFKRGTIADNTREITWSGGEVDPGGSNARNFGLNVVRTANGLPVITAVGETLVSPSVYRYEVRAWGASADLGTPTWTRQTLIASAASVAQQNDGYTSAYAVSGDYVFVAASAARGVVGSAPWDVSWVRASWNGASWSVGTASVLKPGESGPRPPSLVLDGFALPHAVVAYPTAQPPALKEYRGNNVDGTVVTTWTVASNAITVATLSIDASTSPGTLKVMYHYGATNINWKQTPANANAWGTQENTIAWSKNATDLCSSQREFLAAIHGCAEEGPVNAPAVYYFSI